MYNAQYAVQDSWNHKLAEFRAENERIDRENRLALAKNPPMSPIRRDLVAYLNSWRIIYAESGDIYRAKLCVHWIDLVCAAREKTCCEWWVNLYGTTRTSAQQLTLL
jgi:hypothetical protein